MSLGNFGNFIYPNLTLSLGRDINLETKTKSRWALVTVKPSIWCLCQARQSDTVTGSLCPGLWSQSKDPTHTDTEIVTRGSITKGKCRYKSKMCGSVSVVVSTSAWHAADRGSIPGPGALLGVKKLALYITDCVSLCLPEET